MARTQEQRDTASEQAAWFDYQLKQRRNFEGEAISGIDGMLQNGVVPIKVRWDTTLKQLSFSACNPLHAIVPKQTEELQTADRLTHVIHLSEAQYRANHLYRQDNDFIKSIKGNGISDSVGQDSALEQERDLRSGITCGQDDHQIVLWEIYTRDADDWNKITVKTRSPLRFEEEVRGDFEMPYMEGVFKQGWIPFVAWRAEIKDKGYYSPRGIAEILAAFETSLCKSWNFKHEWMDFFSRPQYQETAGFTGNAANVNPGPGSIIPLGLQPTSAPMIPPALAEEMQTTRQLAESRVQVPDFGVMSREGGTSTTATEINAIVGQQGQGTDMRGRVFKLDLGKTFKMAWAILLQYGKDTPGIHCERGSEEARPATFAGLLRRRAERFGG